MAAVVAVDGSGREVSMDDVEKDIEKGAKNVPEDSASTSTTATSSAVKLSPTGGHKKYETAGGGKIPQLPRAPCMLLRVPCRRLPSDPAHPDRLGNSERGDRVLAVSPSSAPRILVRSQKTPQPSFFPVATYCHNVTAASLHLPQLDSANLLPLHTHARTHARTRACAPHSNHWNPGNRMRACAVRMAFPTPN